MDTPHGRSGPACARADRAGPGSARIRAHIERILKVSSFSTPSTWDLQTDRGNTQMVLKAEEDIRKLSGRSKLLIAGQDGVQFKVPNTAALDKHSRKLLERFL